jgi:hypothetical protein
VGCSEFLVAAEHAHVTQPAGARGGNIGVIRRVSTSVRVGPVSGFTLSTASASETDANTRSGDLAVATSIVNVI